MARPAGQSSEEHTMKPSVSVLLMAAMTAFACSGMAAGAPDGARVIAPGPAVDAKGLPPVPVIKVMAIGHFDTPPSPERLRAMLPEEMSETGWLYMDGKMDQWYVRKDREGVVFILNVTSVDEARQLLSTLPLSKAHLLMFDFIPLGPLQPLGTLLRPRPAN
jgi:hypothetical protein